MLVLSRKLNETLVIGEDIRITIVEVRGNQIRLGIEAPRNVAVHRAEVKDKIDAMQLNIGCCDPAIKDTLNCIAMLKERNDFCETMRQICERDHEGENDVE